MKTKAFFLATLVFVFLVISSLGTHAQTTKSSLDQFKLMQQALGTWEATIGKDTVEVRETQQYGKAFTTNVYYNIKGNKSPEYINYIWIDSKEGNIKGFTLLPEGDYRTFIGLWTTEKKLTLDVVQNFKPETIYRKIELLFEPTAKMTWINFNTDGSKAGEYKFNKVK
jgi:hypothetical protein